MNKKATERVVNTIPTILQNALSYLKDNFDENIQDALGSASGTTGIIIKLFGQPFIDSYFEKQTEKKLEYFGLDTYLKASFAQAEESLNEIAANLDQNLPPDSVYTVTNQILQGELKNFEPGDVILIFQPKYHPTVLFVKNSYIRILKGIKATPADIKAFQKHFNDNIESQVAQAFGDDYETHLAETEEFRLKDNETTFLWAMTELGRIGFKETEDLKYELTYAQWKKVADFHKKDREKLNDEEFEQQEQALKPIDDLINAYFDQGSDNHLEKILFVISDFGKGKSVFLRQQAAKLARNYLETGEGLFPVYFNLRNFKNYSSEPKLGVISDFLETEYGIKIDNDYFKKKCYIFLIDSLDESGELNKASIDQVIGSVQRIQNIDKTLCRTNRMIITSRPFDDGLDYHLRSHQPHIIKNKEGRDIEYFISIYGFTKQQFNNWLKETLSGYEDLDKIRTTGFAHEIIQNVKNKEAFDAYEQLLKNKTLSRGELRRPIFAYMIYQLILNNIDFLSVGKIGVYLSFLNLLTKEAKHIHDINYRINLKEEFKFRSILHAIAALWMYERQQGKQGVLKKADICRVLDGERKQNETDNQILERYKNEGVLEIRFLSHSYFGENDNVLHFQHQSFAEILLAEYYLKVFIKYALDEDVDSETARTKLILGEPTEQTIQFFKEMLQLLRETAVAEVTDEVIEKRKLLFPLMASLATEKRRNSLFCNDIYYKWYRPLNLPENQTEYPREALETWCIDQEGINRVVDLALNMLESKTNYLLTRAVPKTALYDNELLAIQNNKITAFPPDIDRWLALLVGNALFNDVENQLFFNGKIKQFEHLFDLIRNWNYAFGSSAPSWGFKLFYGIDMRANHSTVNLSLLNLYRIDFSHSYLNNIVGNHSNYSHCSFRDAELVNVDMTFSNLAYSYFSGVVLENTNLQFCMWFQGLLVPAELTKYFCQETLAVEIGKSKCYIGGYLTEEIGTRFGPHLLNMIFRPFRGLLTYGLKYELFTIAKIKSWFEFETEEIKTAFFKEIDTLAAPHPESED